jgi:hypothetical protein
MSSWGNYDNAANAPYWAVNSAIAHNGSSVMHAAPTAANVSYLYGNTTSGAYIAGETIGLFMVDSAEEQVKENAGVHPVHSGCTLKTTGSGGRAGRVTYETLVALASVQSDNNADDSSFADATITIVNPIAVGGPVSAASANTVTFSVVGTSAVPSSATLSYQWQVNNNSGGSWVDITPGTGVTGGQPGQMIKTGANTATLILDPTGTSANNYVFRAVVTATNPGITNSSAVAYSANARILITA